ncbi:MULTISPECIES: NCS2 family permease [Actinomycetaceae]|uniref:NCS2 family permease n=1 Tax=Actinomycetaceae TaxID=2049 RepID=UPI001ECA12E5|nr:MULTISPECIES: NCS2 family permease [Actinomycetaceae]MBS5827144.1 NCS2 family permease [Actinomyces sp.]MDK7142940.1 NCS2 family permease [Gleimia europaea]MDU5569484.1 NCS2 family permease [Actinomyces sp.]
MSTNTAQRSKLDSFFHITERGSTIGREVRGGFVTFFAMAYILVLNPIILSAAFPEDGSLTIPTIAAATALVAGVMTILMGLVANYPMALAAGMGLNAMVAFTLVLGSGLTFQEAMGLIVWEGILITILVLTGFREAVFNAVPNQLKVAISVGIGLFIAFVGLINAGIIRPGGTPVQLGIDGSLAGWPALVFVVGLLLTIVLYVRKVRGAILIGIISSTVLAVIIQAIVAIGPKSDENPTGWGVTVPELSGSPVSLPDFSSLGAFDLFGAFGKLGPLAVVLLIFSLMLADFFDTMGTMVAIGAEGDLLDENGTPPRSRQILVIDSLAAIAGGLAGTSSNTSYVESSAGVGEGARTGLASVVTGILFLLSIFLAPVVELVPTEAASTALVFVGFLMMTQVLDIEWKRPEIAIPAFLTIAFMPFAYSISVGIGTGFITYVIAAVAVGKAKQVKPLMWIVSVLFAVYFVLGPIQAALGA